MGSKGLELGTNAAPPHPAAWRAQRIGWVLLGMFVVAAALGVFGDGPASTQRVADAGGQFTLEYERFARIDAPVQMRIEIAPHAGARNIELWLAREYAHHIEIETISPQPVSTAAGREALFYRFRVIDAPTTITFSYKPRTAGRLHAAIGVAGAPGIAFTQWVYP